MQNPVTWQDLLRDALVKSLPELSLTPSDLPSGDRVTVSVTVDGDALKGTVYVVCGQSFLERTCPISDNDPEVLEDWTSELANLILGRFKNLLLGLGVSITVQPPRKESRIPSGTLTYSFDDHGHKIGLIANLQGTLSLIVGKNIAELMPGDAVYRLSEPAHTKKNYDVISKIRSGVASEEFEDDLEGDAPDWNGEEVEQIELPIRQRRDLEALSWDRMGMVHLLFSGNLSCTFAPAVLLQEGCSSITLEGFVIQVECVKGNISISIPELCICFSQPERLSA